MMKRMRGVFLVQCLLILSLAGCDRLSTTNIGELLKQPREYSGKQVTISGTVTGAFSLVVVKYFVVRDETGEITVVTERPLPKKGSEVKVKGILQEAFSIGDRQMIVLIEAADTK